MATAATISGPLSPEALDEALKLLQESGGHVAVSDGVRDAFFLFTMAGVRIVACGFPPPSLSQWLVLGGYVDPQQRQELVEAHRQGRDEREVITDLGIDPEKVRAGARSLGVQLLLDCLFWPKAQFEAGAGRPYYLERLKRDQVSERALPTPLKDMLDEVAPALRQAALAHAAFPTLGVSLVTAGTEVARSRQEQTEDELERSLLECLLSRPGASGEELKAMLGCGEAAVMQRVRTLVKANVVTAERRPLVREDWERRVKAMQERLEGRPAINQIVLRLAYVAGLEEVGRTHDAARQLDRVGWLLLGQERHEEALGAFDSALALAPQDLEALQGRVNSLTALQRTRPAAKAAVTLGERYLERGLPNQAKLALAQALSNHPSPRAQELLVKAVDQLGDRSLARELAETLVPSLRHSGRTEEADALAARYGFERATTRIVNEPKSAAVFAVPAVLALLLAGALGFLAQSSRAELETRKHVAQALTDLELGLRQARSGDELLALFPPEWERDPTLGEQIAGIRAELPKLAADSKSVPYLRTAVQFEQADDAEFLLSQLERKLKEAQSTALREPLEARKAELEAYLDSAKQNGRRVAGLAAQSDAATALREAKELVKNFANVPSALRRITLSVEITSEPPGALLRWRGDTAQFKTPFRVEVPLVEKRKLELSLPGHETLRAEINLQDLDSPTPVFTLAPTEEGEK